MNSRKPPGISSGPEVHDKKGIERMRASGRLAAQVLQYAGTLVKVIPVKNNFSFLLSFKIIFLGMSEWRRMEIQDWQLFISLQVTFCSSVMLHQDEHVAILQ